MANTVKTIIFHSLLLLSLAFPAAAVLAGSPAVFGAEIGGIKIWWIAALFSLWFVIALIDYYARRREDLNTRQVMERAEIGDSAWEQDLLLRRVSEVFFKFQEAWGHFDIYMLKSCATENYYRLLIMELGVLKHQQRQNFMLVPQIRDLKILRARDCSDNEKDTVVIEIEARRDNIIMDTETSELLYADYGFFCQYWVFRRENEIWKVDAIRSDTERSHLVETAVMGFAQRNGFFYDPDFGQVTIPNKGAIFRKTDFTRSRVNNHVIGSYCDKIVQFYTYNSRAPKRPQFAAGSDEKRKMLASLENPYGVSSDAALPFMMKYGLGYIVAQAVLPISCHDILIRKKEGSARLAPWGLKRFKTRYEEFNRHFSLFAHPEDDVNSFALLTPNFIEKICDLPFPVSVEIVGNFLYIYTKCKAGVTYEKLLEILTLALDELKV